MGRERWRRWGGPASTLINLLVGFFVGLSSGATVIISQYYGAKNKTDVKGRYILPLPCPSPAAELSWYWALAPEGRLCVSMNTPDDIMRLSVVYMRIYFLGVIPSLIYNMGGPVYCALWEIPTSAVFPDPPPAFNEYCAGYFSLW